MLLNAQAPALTLRAKLFRGLADPTRLTLLELLRDGPRTVGELVAATECSQPNTSTHLRCLHECGLVAREQRGRHVVYRLSDPRIAALLQLADAVLAEVATGVAACLQIPTSEEAQP